MAVIRTLDQQAFLYANQAYLLWAWTKYLTNIEEAYATARSDITRNWSNYQ